MKGFGLHKRLCGRKSCRPRPAYPALLFRLRRRPVSFAGAGKDLAAFRMRRRWRFGDQGLRTNADLMSFDPEEGNSSGLERQAQLRLRRPMQAMAIAFIVTDRAARYAGTVGKIRLRPIEEAAGCPAERWCQNHRHLTLTQGSKLPILGDIYHIGHNTPDF